MNKSVLKEYVSEANRDKLGKLPTLHSTCIRLCGVARPGKTARDRAKREALRNF